MSEQPRHRSTLADHPAVKDVLPLFVARLPGHVANLRSLLAAGDLEGLRIVAHKLHGAGESFGFAEISALGAEVEGRLLAGEDATASVEKLAEYLRGVEGYTEP